MNGVGKLICGDMKEPGLARTALGQLSLSIDDFSKRSIGFLKGKTTQEAIRFGPFCARVLLENSCAALLGRMDSFRLLYLSEFQSRPQYDVGRRAKSSFSWAGDVIPDGEPSDLWSINNEIPKIGRSLFSSYSDHFFWRPAIGGMLDFVGNTERNEASAGLLELDPDEYIAITKGRCSRLYSSLSKSVHWEFFSSALMFDESTVKNSIREACLISGQLGLISHFIPTANARIAPDRALRLYKNLWEKLQ
jgi:hypothetical protein